MSELQERLRCNLFEIDKLLDAVTLDLDGLSESYPPAYHWGGMVESAKRVLKDVREQFVPQVEVLEKKLEPIPENKGGSAFPNRLSGTGTSDE